MWLDSPEPVQGCVRYKLNICDMLWLCMSFHTSVLSILVIDNKSTFFCSVTILSMFMTVFHRRIFGKFVFKIISLASHGICKCDDVLKKLASSSK